MYKRPVHWQPNVIAGNNKKERTAKATFQALRRLQFSHQRSCNPFCIVTRRNRKVYGCRKMPKEFWVWTLRISIPGREKKGKEGRN